MTIEKIKSPKASFLEQLARFRESNRLIAEWAKKQQTISKDSNFIKSVKSNGADICALCNLLIRDQESSYLVLANSAKDDAISFEKLGEHGKKLAELMQKAIAGGKLGSESKSSYLSIGIVFNQEQVTLIKAFFLFVRSYLDLQYGLAALKLGQERRMRLGGQQFKYWNMTWAFDGDSDKVGDLLNQDSELKPWFWNFNELRNEIKSAITHDSHGIAQDDVYVTITRIKDGKATSEKIGESTLADILSTLSKINQMMLELGK